MPKIFRRKQNLNENEQIEFLRDFDLLTTIEEQEAALYLPANIDVGVKIMQQDFVLKQDGTRYSMYCHIDEFKQFGPGIYLLFKLLKYLTVIFGLVSIIAIVLLILLVAENAKHLDEINNEFTSGILKITLYNLIQGNFTPYVLLDFIITVILSISLIFWCEKEKQYTLACLSVGTLTSYFTVIVKNLPEDYDERLLNQYLQEQFGEVDEIYTVRNFGDDLLNYKMMNKIVHQYKEQRAILQFDKDRNCDRLVNKFFEFRNGHKQLKQQIRNNNIYYKPCFSFIQFKKIQDRDRVLFYKQNISNNCFLKIFQNKNHLSNINQNPCQQINQYPIAQQKNLCKKKKFTQLEFQALQIIQCQMEPCGIIWENIHLTNAAIMAKASVMILMMVILMIISIFLIILLSVMQMIMINSKFKDFQRDQVIKTQDSFALMTYCVNLSLSEFYKHADICSKYRSSYFKQVFMSFLVPLSISLFKLILTEIMKGLVSFRREAYLIKKVESQLIIIFIFYFAVTGIFQLIIYIGNNTYSLFNVFTPLIQILVNADFNTSKISLFPDYVPNWYGVSASNILLIGVISFNLSTLGIILYCKIRMKICRYYAKKQKIQIQMNAWLSGYTLEIQYVYAAILTIIYFTMLFGVGMPILYISAFVSFAVLFWSYKYIFITFCQRPLTYNHSINRTIRKIMFGALILHCIFAPIFLRAPGIANFSLQTYSMVERFTSLWYYLLLMAILIVYFLFQHRIRILFRMLHQNVKKITKKRTDKEEENEKKWKEFQKKRLERSLRRRNFSLPSLIRQRQNELANESYSMHQNEEYKDILKTLYTINNKQRTRKNFHLNSQLRQIYEDNIKNSQICKSKYKTLMQVIQAVRKDYKKYRKNHGNIKNPYQNSKNKLYQIYQITKQKQNRKYTLYYSNSLIEGINNQNIGDGQINDKQLALSDQHLTNNMLVTQNLQKVVQQPQDLQTSDFKNSQQKKSSKNMKQDEKQHGNKQKRLKGKKNNQNAKVQIPPISQDRLNQRVV